MVMVDEEQEEAREALTAGLRRHGITASSEDLEASAAQLVEVRRALRELGEDELAPVEPMGRPRFDG